MYYFNSQIICLLQQPPVECLYKNDTGVISVGTNLLTDRFVSVVVYYAKLVQLISVPRKISQFISHSGLFIVSYPGGDPTLTIIETAVPNPVYRSSRGAVVGVGV